MTSRSGNGKLDVMDRIRINSVHNESITTNLNKIVICHSYKLSFTCKELAWHFSDIRHLFTYCPSSELCISFIPFKYRIHLLEVAPQMSNFWPHVPSRSFRNLRFDWWVVGFVVSYIADHYGFCWGPYCSAHPF